MRAQKTCGRDHRGDAAQTYERQRVGMTADEIECTEQGGTEPTIALLRHLAAALDADLHLTAGHDLSSVWFDPTQLDPTSTAVCGHGAYRHTLPPDFYHGLGI